MVIFNCAHRLLQFVLSFVFFNLLQKRIRYSVSDRITIGFRFFAIWLLKNSSFDISLLRTTEAFNENFTFMIAGHLIIDQITSIRIKRWSWLVMTKRARISIFTNTFCFSIGIVFRTLTSTTTWAWFTFTFKGWYILSVNPWDSTRKL